MSKEPKVSHKDTHKEPKTTHKAAQLNLLDMIEEVSAVKKMYETLKDGGLLDPKFTGDWEKDRFEIEKVFGNLINNKQKHERK